ncbi:MAG: TetR/AcrR family transcriptional regulator [Alphaproteobacteria bacterium]
MSILTNKFKKEKDTYHHGNLAESLLNAVDEIATKFGLEAVTLRACAKLIGVSPSSAFRHYADKRTLLTAFATRALTQLSEAMELAKKSAEQDNQNLFSAVGVAYIRFALEKPAFFRAMWREEAIYTADESYVAASGQLAAHLQGGFANSLQDTNPHEFSPQELLAWSAVHGLANLFVDGPVGLNKNLTEKVNLAKQMIAALNPALTHSNNDPNLEP